MKHLAKKGFTLIELAVVIAIIAILAAVAIPRFADTTTSAELSVLQNLKSQMVSAAAMATARQGTPPNNLAFITANATLGNNETLTTASMVNKATGQPACPTPAGNVMNCTLSRWTAQYTLNPATGIITGVATPGANAGRTGNVNL